MNIIGGKIARYFGLRFLNAVLLTFAGITVLVALLDYIELMRRAADLPNVSAALVAKTSLYRVPQVTERILPFCVLIGAMSCYLNFSRRLELVVARAAGGVVDLETTRGRVLHEVRHNHAVVTAARALLCGRGPTLRERHRHPPCRAAPAGERARSSGHH